MVLLGECNFVNLLKCEFWIIFCNVLIILTYFNNFKQPSSYYTYNHPWNAWKQIGNMYFSLLLYFSVFLKAQSSLWKLTFLKSNCMIYSCTHAEVGVKSPKKAKREKKKTWCHWKVFFLGMLKTATVKRHVFGQIV